MASPWLTLCHPEGGSSSQSEDLTQSKDRYLPTRHVYATALVAFLKTVDNPARFFAGKSRSAAEARAT